MAELVNNKVAESGIVTIDLASLLPSTNIIVFDIKPYLYMELILKEKDFRAALLTTDWTIYQDKIVGIICSADAIIPMWANMLVVSALNPFATAVYFGDEKSIIQQQLIESISKLNVTEFTNQRVVIKGCGETYIGETAYVAITQKLRPLVKSIMYGEPCSTVPVYKRKD
jgi:hypothetical protein